MRTGVAIAVGVLAAGVIALSTALAVVLVREDNGSPGESVSDRVAMMGYQMPYSYDQMRQMMGSGNWDLMWQHMQDHAAGAPDEDANPQLDRAMHTMMDWMMSGWTPQQWKAFLTPTPQP